jgi:hypothetical protein
VRKLHLAFGHPSVEKLTNLLKMARPDEMNTDVRQSIEALSKECQVCLRTRMAPRRFKLTMGMDDVQFNHIVAVDVMYLDGKPVLHIVDEATHFQTAAFLTKVTAEETWNVLSCSWSRMYLGPPDFLRIDQGTNFTAREFIDSAAGEGISVLEAPIVSHHDVPRRAIPRTVATCVHEDTGRQYENVAREQLADGSKVCERHGRT